MKITRLQGPDIRVALDVARSIFAQTIAPYLEDGQIQQYFDEYVAGVEEDAAQGGLTVWGAVQNNTIIGMSALNPEGHITMIYVYPTVWKQGIGRALIKEMNIFAYSEYGLKEITTNAMPSWCAPFFYKCGFYQSQDNNGIGGYIPLKAKTVRIKRYKTKKIPAKIVLSNIFVCLALIIAVIVWYIL